jgi:tetratricopeptide (TPR) repeat protein
MIERDYLMRLLSQLAAVMAKILGAKNAQNFAEARLLAQNACEQLFGLNGELVKTMDAGTLALLLGEKEKIKALAALLREDGDILLLQGNAAEGVGQYEKALALYQEARRASPAGDADCETAIAALEAKLGEVAGE